MMIHVPELCSEYNGTNIVDKGGLHFTSVVQMSCNSRCPFRETKVRCDEDIHGFACTAGEEIPSHLTHMKFPVQFPRSQCAGSECPLLSGGEWLLLTQGDKVTCGWDLDWAAHKLCSCKKSTPFLPACGLAHTSVLILCMRLSQDNQSQDMLSPAEKAQGDTLLILHLYLPLLKTFPVRDKLMKR